MSLVADTRFSVEYETFSPLCINKEEAYVYAAEPFWKLDTPCLGKTHYVIEGTGYIPYLKNWEERCIQFVYAYQGNPHLDCTTVFTLGEIWGSPISYPRTLSSGFEAVIVWVSLLVLVYLLWEFFKPKKKGNKKCLQTGKRR